MIVVGGWTAGALVLGITVAVLAGLRLLRPDMFARIICRPLRRVQTGAWYRRDWGRITDLCGLTKDLDGRTLHPDLLLVGSDPTGCVKPSRIGCGSARAR